MKKTNFKLILVLVSITMFSSILFPSIVLANESNTYVGTNDYAELPETIDENLNIDSLTNFISEQLDDDNNDVPFTDEGVFINGNFYTPDEFDNFLKNTEDPEELEIKITADEQAELNNINDEDGPQKQSAFYIPAIGWTAAWVYTIPGVGQAALIATAAVGIGVGVYVFKKNVIRSGHWAYNRIRNHVRSRNRPRTTTRVNYNYRKSVSKRDYISYAYGIPKGLIDSNGNVKLGNMNQKVRGKKWKIKDRNGNRKGSTDGNDKILSK